MFDGNADQRVCENGPNPPQYHDDSDDFGCHSKPRSDENAVEQHQQRNLGQHEGSALERANSIPKLSEESDNVACRSQGGCEKHLPFRILQLVLASTPTDAVPIHNPEPLWQFQHPSRKEI